MHITVHLGIHLCPMPLVAFTGRAGDVTAPFPQKLQGTRRQPGEVMERHPDSALPSTSLIMRDPDSLHRRIASFLTLQKAPAR